MQEDMLGFIYKQILHVLNVNDFKAGSKSFLKALCNVYGITRFRFSPWIFVSTVYGRRARDSVVDGSCMSVVVRVGLAVMGGAIGVRVRCHGAH